MRKGNATKAAILGQALRQASRLGLENLSLGPLAESLSLSKSGLFAHFRSKEALQLEVLEEAVERFKVRVVEPGIRSKDAVKRLRALHDAYLAWLRGGVEEEGCLFVTMAQEYDDRPGPIRDRLVATQSDWRRLLMATVGEAKAQGALAADADAAQLVFEFIGSALAYQHATKLLGDRTAMKRAREALNRSIAASTRAFVVATH